MAVTRIGVLGPLHISIDGQRVPPGAPMQCAVLGRLVAAGGRVVPTDRLIDDLWHGDPPAKAVAALQVYIHNLRRVFEPDRPRRARSRVIVSESHGYALNLEPAQVDSWHFEQLLHAHEVAMRDPVGRPDPLAQSRALDTALACWHGTAFESFAGMPWAAQEAARLHALRLTAAELRAQAALDMNRPAEVVLALRPVLEEYPGREESARLLALAQYRLGQSLDALDTVRRSREFLTLEFGVDPGPGLRDLETAILTHSVDAETTAPILLPAPERGPEPLPAPESLPDNGYPDQHAAILAAAETAATGQARLVWLAGEAGAGKTTLAAAVVDRLAAQGWTAVFGRCPEVEGAPPAWAWAEVLTGLDAADPETFTAADAFTLARRVVRSCRERSAAAPVAIVLEDVHGADTATLQVLRQVVNWLRDCPILIVATLRGTEAVAGVRDTAAALALFTAGRVELGGLDMAGTRRAAAAAGLTVLDDHTVELLRHRTGGNPLFVRELAKLVAVHGMAGGLPDSVRDLLGHRVSQLPDAVVEVLRHLSVWGEDSDITTLADTLGLAADTVIDHVATAEGARLLRTERGNRVTFDHALVRETVYHDIPVLRRTRMHWAAFEYLRREPETGTGPAHGTDATGAGGDEPAANAGSASRTEAHNGSRVLSALRGADQVVAALVGGKRTAREGRDAAEGSGSSSTGGEAISAALGETGGVVLPETADAVGWYGPPRAGDGADGEEVTVPSGRDIDALAHHAALGADPETAGIALPYVRAAARRCVERRMRADAVRRWRSVLGLHDLAGHAESTAAQQDREALLRARCELVTALAYDGQHMVARAVREKALDLARSLGDTALLAHAATCWPTPLIWSVQDWHTTDPRLREPLRIALEDKGLPAHTRVALLVTTVFDQALEDPAAARSAAREALAAAERTDDPDLLCTVLNAQAFAEFAGGSFLRGGELRDHATRLLHVSTEAELTEFRALAHYLLFRLTLAEADLIAAAAHARNAGEYATDGQLRHLLDALAPFGMVLELLRGNIDAVDGQLAHGPLTGAEIVDYSAEGAAEPTRDANALHVGIAVSLGWIRGDMSVYLDELRERAAVKPELFVYGHALALVDAGRPEEARQVMAAAPPLGPQFRPTFSAVEARLAIALDDRAAARDLYQRLLPYAGTICGLETGATVLGPMDDVLAELATALGEHDRAATHRSDAGILRNRVRADADRLIAGESGIVRMTEPGPIGRSRLVRHR